MKRILPILLILMLLVGCGKNDADETTQETTPQVVIGSNHSTYVADSDIEKTTDGAVRLYDLADHTADVLTQAGDRLLLISTGEETKLTVLSGNDCVIAATLTIPGELSVWQSTYGGFAYYDTDNNQAVFLDPQLQETQRHQLPDEIMGVPAFSPDGGQIFFCVGQEIRSLDTQMNVTRPIRTLSSNSQTLTGAYLAGDVLSVSMKDDTGEESTLYISTQTGESLSADKNVLTINSYENTYLATRRDGIVNQYIYGTEGSEPQQMNVSESDAAGAAELNGVVGYTVMPEALELGFYDLDSGRKTGSVSIPGNIEPVKILADRWSGCVWILTADNTLLRWDPKLSAVDEERVYTTPIYSADAPDETGLEALQDRVDRMNRAYGVTLRIWQAAVKSSNGYDLVPEYQTAAISDTLDQLEQLLQEFPDNFLYKSVKRTIRICVVRSVDGEMTSAYYWYDKDPFIILSAGVDVRQEFLKAFAYVLDVHVLGNSSMVDLWADLNPEGFTYGAESFDGAWLEGDTRAFADEGAMASVIDDRASVFYQAMKKDNAEMFASEIMQAKLLQLCKAIRDAWRLEQKTESYLWEQYLTESIAYVE